MGNEEFNTISYTNDEIPINTTLSANLRPQEVADNPANRQIPEFQNAKNSVHKSKTAEKIIGGLSLSAFLAAILAMLPLPGKADASIVTFESLKIFATAIDISVRVENRGTGKYVLEVSNYFTCRSTEITGDRTVHTEENLRPGLYYDVAVKNGRSVISERKVKTTLSNNFEKQHEIN